jgi:serine/threonine protein kinase
MPVAPGTRLGPYEVLAQLGAGGMGEVYRARDTRLDRDVAIKVLPPFAAEDPEFRARFDREAKVISQLNHPNICALYDVGDGFIVMELIEAHDGRRTCVTVSCARRSATRDHRRRKHVDCRTR